MAQSFKGSVDCGQLWGHHMGTRGRGCLNPGRKETRERKGQGTRYILQKGIPSYLLLPARHQLLTFPPPPKTVPLLGPKYATKWEIVGVNSYWSHNSLMWPRVAAETLPCRTKETTVILRTQKGRALWRRIVLRRIRGWGGGWGVHLKCHVISKDGRNLVCFKDCHFMPEIRLWILLVSWSVIKFYSYFI